LEHSFVQFELAIEECNAIKDLFMVGVSHATNLDEFQTAQIAYFNDLAQSYAGDDRYVTPLLQNEVEILPNDKTGIHHKPSTTKRIIDAIASASTRPLRHPVF
jgi:hypothetical protein